MSDFNDPDHLDDDIEWVSKSEMKREMERLQGIGEQLLSVKPGDLVSFPISDTLRDAVEESRRIKSNEARRRHLQYIGKVIRSEDVERIQMFLDRLDPTSELYVRITNLAEHWRLRLLTEKEAVEAWLEEFPETDRQPFRALIRQSAKEQKGDPNGQLVGGKNTKKLLQYLKQQLLDHI